MTLRRWSAAVMGLVSWFVLVTVLGRALQAAWSDYGSRVEAFDFTPGMLVARLAVGAVATVAAGRVAAWWSGHDRASLWILGIALVVIFLPVHYELWTKFPVVYHLTFLGTLVPLTLWGGRAERSDQESTRVATT